MYIHKHCAPYDFSFIFLYCKILFTLHELVLKMGLCNTHTQRAQDGAVLCLIP